MNDRPMLHCGHALHLPRCRASRCRQWLLWGCRCCYSVASCTPPNAAPLSTATTTTNVASSLNFACANLPVPGVHEIPESIVFSMMCSLGESRPTLSVTLCRAPIPTPIPIHTTPHSTLRRALPQSFRRQPDVCGLLPTHLWQGRPCRSGGGFG